MGKDIHLKIANILLIHGANPKAIDDFGDTPLDNAKHGNYEEFISLIEDHLKNEQDKTKGERNREEEKEKKEEEENKKEEERNRSKGGGF